MSGTSSGDDDRLSRIPEQIKQQAAGIGPAVRDAVGPKAEDIADRSKAASAGVARTAQALVSILTDAGVSPPQPSSSSQAGPPSWAWCFS